VGAFTSIEAFLSGGGIIVRLLCGDELFSILYRDGPDRRGGGERNAIPTDLLFEDSPRELCALEATGVTTSVSRGSPNSSMEG